jgi:hypothetical protein
MAKVARKRAKAASKATGPRKTRRVPKAEVDEFGFRKGSLKSKAAAMYASRDGATLAEVRKRLNSTQFNLLTELKKKKFKVHETEVPGAGGRKATNYHVVA